MAPDRSTVAPHGWPGPGEGCSWALAGEGDSPHRWLIVPPLFDEAQRSRNLLARLVRALAAEGIAAMLPDLPGCGESLVPFDAQSLVSWRAAIDAAATWWGASHVLALRGGALVAPPALPGWWLDPCPGPEQLRPLLRAEVLRRREAGRDATSTTLLATGCAEGLTLAGYACSPALITALAQASLPEARATPLAFATLAPGSAEPAPWRVAVPRPCPASLAALVTRIATASA